MSLAVAVPGRLRLVAALKQYGLCEGKMEAAHLRSEIKCCFLPACGPKAKGWKLSSTLNPALL